MPKLHTTITVPVTIHFDADIGERKTSDSPEVPPSITINDVSIIIRSHFHERFKSLIFSQTLHSLSPEYNINNYAMLPNIESELQELVQDNESDWRND